MHFYVQTKCFWSIHYSAFLRQLSSYTCASFSNPLMRELIINVMSRRRRKFEHRFRRCSNNNKSKLIVCLCDRSRKLSDPDRQKEVCFSVSEMQKNKQVLTEFPNILSSVRQILSYFNAYGSFFACLAIQIFSRYFPAYLCCSPFVALFFCKTFMQLRELEPSGNTDPVNAQNGASPGSDTSVHGGDQGLPLVQVCGANAHSVPTSQRLDTSLRSTSATSRGSRSAWRTRCGTSTSSWRPGRTSSQPSSTFPASPREKSARGRLRLPSSSPSACPASALCKT